MARSIERHCWDNSLHTAVTIAPPKEGGPGMAAVRVRPAIYCARAVAGRAGPIPVGKILASDDGIDLAHDPEYSRTAGISRRIDTGRLRFQR